MDSNLTTTRGEGALAEPGGPSAGRTWQVGAALRGVPGGTRDQVLPQGGAE